MNDRLQIEDLLLGDGKEVVKGALITTQSVSYTHLTLPTNREV